MKFPPQIVTKLSDPITIHDSKNLGYLTWDILTKGQNFRKTKKIEAIVGLYLKSSFLGKSSNSYKFYRKANY